MLPQPYLWHLPAQYCPQQIHYDLCCFRWADHFWFYDVLPDVFGSLVAHVVSVVPAVVVAVAVRVVYAIFHACVICVAATLPVAVACVAFCAFVRAVAVVVAGGVAASAPAVGVATSSPQHDCAPTTLARRTHRVSHDLCSSAVASPRTPAAAARVSGCAVADARIVYGCLLLQHVCL